jgi:hypothetical protein
VALGTGEGNEEQVHVRDERVREMGPVGVDSTELGPSGPIHLIWSGSTNWAQPNQAFWLSYFRKNHL